MRRERNDLPLNEKQLRTEKMSRNNFVVSLRGILFGNTSRLGVLCQRPITNNHWVVSLQCQRGPVTCPRGGAIVSAGWDVSESIFKSTALQTHLYE